MLYRPVVNDPNYEALSAALAPNMRAWALLQKAVLRSQREFLVGLIDVVDSALKDVGSEPPKREHVKVK